MTMKLLKFEADWCGPCTQQATILEEYDATPVESIDVDENQQMANDYNVRGLPTLVLVGEDGPIKQWSGLTQVDEIEAVVQENE
jgi:thioredoxin 1